MRQFDKVVFDDIILGTAPLYSDPQLNELLGSADQLAIQVISSRLGASVSLSVAIEHSPDGKTWKQRNTDPEIDRVLLSGTTTENRIFYQDASIPLSEMVRLRVELDAVAPARVKVLACGRSAGLSEEEKPCCDACSTSSSSKNQGCGCGGSGAAKQSPAAPVPGRRMVAAVPPQPFRGRRRIGVSAPAAGAQGHRGFAGLATTFAGIRAQSLTTFAKPGVMPRTPPLIAVGRSGLGLINPFAEENWVKNIIEHEPTGSTGDGEGVVVLEGGQAEQPGTGDLPPPGYQSSNEFQGQPQDLPEGPGETIIDESGVEPVDDDSPFTENPNFPGGSGYGAGGQSGGGGSGSGDYYPPPPTGQPSGWFMDAELGLCRYNQQGKLRCLGPKYNNAAYDPDCWTGGAPFKGQFTCTSNKGWCWSSGQVGTGDYICIPGTDVPENWKPIAPREAKAKFGVKDPYTLGARNVCKTMSPNIACKKTGECKMEQWETYKASVTDCWQLSSGKELAGCVGDATVEFAENVTECEDAFNPCKFHCKP